MEVRVLSSESSLADMQKKLRVLLKGANNSGVRRLIECTSMLIKLLSWQVPVQLMLEEMLNRLLPLGIAALMPAHRLRDRSILARRGWEEEKMRSIEVCKKMEIEIVYLVDFLLLMRT